MAKTKKPAVKAKTSQLLAPIAANKQTLFCLAILAAACMAGVVGWRKWSSQIYADPKYVIRPQHVSVSIQPSYIRRDIKADVVADGALDDLSLLDGDAVQKIAKAFQAHPWIAATRRVVKAPGPKVTVEVEYRRPAALVAMEVNGERGVLVVDSEGVVLPSDDFLGIDGSLIDEARRLPRVAGQANPPLGEAGEPWGDDRIHGAASLAAALAAHWQSLGFHRISWTTPALSADRPIYLLLTRDGREVIWGEPGKHEQSVEPTTAEKVAQLLEEIETHGPFEQRESWLIDLRRYRSDEVSTAETPLESPR